MARHRRQTSAVTDRLLSASVMARPTKIIHIQEIRSYAIAKCRAITPHILKFGINCRWRSNIHLNHVTPGEESHGTYWLEGCVTCSIGLEVLEKRNICNPCLESKQEWSVVQSLVTIPTGLYRPKIFHEIVLLWSCTSIVNGVVRYFV
jgi:hypothetical protein